MKPRLRFSFFYPFGVISQVLDTMTRIKEKEVKPISQVIIICSIKGEVWISEIKIFKGETLVSNEHTKIYRKQL